MEPYTHPGNNSSVASACNGADVGCHGCCRITADGTDDIDIAIGTPVLSIDNLLDNNRAWARQCVGRDPEFFARLRSEQHPDYFFVGCADSRISVNEMVGLPPGNVFVQRNVGNQVSHRDLNCMACLEYAIAALGVKHIIVAGHYGCGAVKAALTMPNASSSLVNLWIQEIRSVRDAHSEELLKYNDVDVQCNQLSELNVMQQVFNVCTSPAVAASWERGQPLAVHGVVYDVGTGTMKELLPPVTGMDVLERLGRRNSIGISPPMQKRVEIANVFARRIVPS